MRKILFVDDEPRVLQGLRRMLHSTRGEWEIDFAEGGPAALQILEKKKFDVVVSDMRMPGMDGAQLLDRVMKSYPEVVRIVLSGQSDEQEILRCVGKTHQFLAKPCNAETIKATITRACALRDLLSNARIKEVVSQITSLPSLPTLYLKLMEELRSPDASIKKVSSIISNDVGMVAKILQIVNSAFFGNYTHVTNPERAVSVLGLKTIGALVLSAHVFSQFDKGSLRAFKIEQVTNHSLTVSSYARAIASAENLDQSAVDDAVTAGLLHDVGKVILAANLPHKYSVALEKSANDNNDTWWAEREVLQASHNEVGAYLLGLWGLPDTVVEAVAYHHTPDKCTHTKFSPLTAVHVADVWEHEFNKKNNFGPEPQVDENYIETIGLTKRLPHWRNLCLEINSERKAA